MNKDEFSSVHFYLFDDVYFLRWNMRAFTLICILKFVQIQMAIRTKSHRGDFVSLKTPQVPPVGLVTFKWHARIHAHLHI